VRFRAEKGHLQAGQNSHQRLRDSVGVYASVDTAT
jgi:hypothetical protein